MRYITQINAFYDWLETNKLSTSAIALWHALMHINNKTGWAKEFGVATSVLSVKTGLSKRTIVNARNELKQKGRIEWRSRRGNQSAVYSIIPFPENLHAIIADNTSHKDKDNDLQAIDAHNTSHNVSHNTSHSVSHNASTLYREEKIREEEDNDDIVVDPNDPYVFYTRNIGPMMPMIADLISQYQEDLPDELITEAFKIAVKANKRDMRYAEKIMINWLNQGIKTMDDYRRHESERNHQKAVKAGEVKNEPKERQYSKTEIEAAAAYIKKAVARYEGNDVIGFINSLGYPEEIASSAINLLIERKELVV